MCELENQSRLFPITTQVRTYIRTWVLYGMLGEPGYAFSYLYGLNATYPTTTVLH